MDIEKLRKELRADEEGRLWWVRPRQGRARKRPAGSRTVEGYIYICVDGHRLMAHKIVWALAHGRWPEHTLDHINRVRDDNRLENLREAEPWAQALNSALVGGKTLPANIYKPRDGSFRVRIVAAEKTYERYFPSLSSAVLWRDAIRSKLGHESHADFAPGVTEVP